MSGEAGTRVVVGVDWSVAGLRALRVASMEARWRGAQLHALRVWGGEASWAGPIGTGWRGQAEQEAVVLLRQAFDAAMGGPPADLPVYALTVGGPVGLSLVNYANRDEDLLVIGASRRRWLSTLIRGSVSRYCATHATCPVLVVPPHELARDGSARSLARQLRREAEQLTSR